MVFRGNWLILERLPVTGPPDLGSFNTLVDDSQTNVNHTDYVEFFLDLAPFLAVTQTQDSTLTIFRDLGASFESQPEYAFLATWIKASLVGYQIIHNGISGAGGILPVEIEAALAAWQSSFDLMLAQTILNVGLWVHDESEIEHNNISMDSDLSVIAAAGIVVGGAYLQRVHGNTVTAKSQIAIAPDDQQQGRHPIALTWRDSVDLVETNMRLEVSDNTFNAPGGYCAKPWNTVFNWLNRFAADGNLWNAGAAEFGILNTLNLSDNRFVLDEPLTIMQTEGSQNPILVQLTGGELTVLAPGRVMLQDNFFGIIEELDPQAPALAGEVSVTIELVGVTAIVSGNQISGNLQVGGGTLLLGNFGTWEAIPVDVQIQNNRVRGVFVDEEFDGNQTILQFDRLMVQGNRARSRISVNARNVLIQNNMVGPDSGSGIPSINAFNTGFGLVNANITINGVSVSPPSAVIATLNTTGNFQS